MSFPDRDRGRTTRDGNLPLVAKRDQPEPSTDPFGRAADAPSGDAPRGGDGYGGGGYGGGGYGGPSGAQLEPMATASLICGVLSLAMLCCCGLFTFVLAPVAIILGVLSLLRIRNQPEAFTGGGMAWGGIVTGSLAFGLILAYFAMIIIVQLLEAAGQL